MVEQCAAFPQFPQLPKEIQLLVWSFAVLDPRMIHIESGLVTTVWTDRGDKNTDPSNINEKEEICLTKIAIPPVLHACYDSRVAGLKVFKAVGKAQFGHLIYVNFNLDIFQFADKHISKLFVKLELNRVFEPVVEDEEEEPALMDSIKYIFATGKAREHTVE